MAAVSFPFTGGEIERASEQAGTWGELKGGRKWEGMSAKVERVGRKGKVEDK